MKNDNRPACGGWAPGKYLCKCGSCKQTYQGDKRSYFCADCAYDMASQPPGEPGRVLHTIFTPDNEGAIITTRHEAARARASLAAKEIADNWAKDISIIAPGWTAAHREVAERHYSAIIASHYSSLESAAVLARDALRPFAATGAPFSDGTEISRRYADFEWLTSIVKIGELRNAKTALDALNAVLTNAPNQH